jgi:sugar phosphate isomerase/epimerase
MFITGISDEAGKDLATQIRAHKELNWGRMEIRDVSIDGGPADNIHNISDPDFDKLERRIKDAGMEVYCFSSRIANWGKQSDEPFDSSLEEARRSITRMRRLNTRFIRIMSFAIRKDKEDQMARERFRRLRELVRMFTDEGLTALHENCMNYGGMGWPFTLELLENVPGLKLVFDTGNPVFADDRGKPAPWPKQSAWEFYNHVRDHIAYIHIKDGIWNTETNSIDFCFPGEGQADVKKIIGDLASRGYDGGLSIEPHRFTTIQIPAIRSPRLIQPMWNTEDALKKL